MLQNRPVFDEEHALLRESVRRFAATKIQPHFGEWEEAGIIDRSLWPAAGKAGLLCAQVPEQYGGIGGDFRHNAVVIEELSYSGFAGPATDFSVHSDVCCGYLLHYGSEEQKKKWLPRMVAGETVCAIAMTEPGTGSDLQAVRTTAKREGDEYVINGQKTFITNGQLSDLVIVVAKTDTTKGAKGTSLILVERERAGFTRGRNLEKLGMHAQDTSELFFSDVRVPVTNLLGAEGRGFAQLMEELPRERLVVAVTAVALMEAAFEWTLAYTRERKVFGRPIADFQNSRFRLAEIKTEITIARVFLNDCIEKHLNGALDVTTAAMAKYWLTELEGRVLDTCLQLFGGYGYMWEFPIARAYVDARVQRIYGGTNEIMKEVISRSLGLGADK